MTTLTPAFFAPDRLNEHHAAKKTAWRPLLVSALIHVLGVVLVVVLSQLNIDNQNARHKATMPMPEISARLYFPPISQSQKVKDVVPPEATELTSDLADSDNAEKQKTTSELQYEPDTSVTNKASDRTIDTQPEKQSQDKKNADVEPKTDVTEPPNILTSPTLSIDANRRAGTLNLSVKDGAAQYFRDYHNNQISEDAERAAAAFQRSKNSPELKGPSTLQREAVENKRPSKRVNCSSTANKTLALLSGFTGGTLECTKMGDHNRFIDARVNKHPVEETNN